MREYSWWLYMESGRIYEIVRKNVIFYRKKNGLTQEKFSELLGVTHDFVRQVESKKVNKNFSLLNIEKAASVLNVELYQFFIDRD